MHRKTCVVCKVQFIALRVDKATCGAKCRKRYERECRNVTEKKKENDRLMAERFERFCDEATTKEG